MDNILGVPVKAGIRCVQCREIIIDDGYGDWVHRDTNNYKCDDDKNGQKVATA